MRLISQELMNAIDRERQRQEEKFPGQVLPATVVQANPGWLYADNAKGACSHAGVSFEENAKEMCDSRPDWSRVLVEKVSEAISSAGRGDAEHTKEELIQVAAVAIRWIEAIDRGEVGFDA